MRNYKYTIVHAALILFVGLILMSFSTTEKVEPKQYEENEEVTKPVSSGKEIYAKNCMVCHQANGQGIPSAFPPLAASDYLNADVSRAIDIVLYGKTGEITVNGVKYNSVMTPLALSDQEVAEVLTYVYNSWGNNKTNVSVSDVQKGQKKIVRISNA